MEIAREIMHQMLNQSAVEKPTLSCNPQTGNISTEANFI
jgi:hypothetical protein